MPSRIRSCALMALMVAVALAGCRTSTEPATTSLLFTEAQVQRADMAQVVQAFGQVSALQDRFLTYETVGGRLLEVLVQVGQQVHEGDAIAQLDTAPLERQLLEAEADLGVAEAVLR
ncbi:MAG: biotin/lipoyl-binding protein, partial [Chloroflexi bacterium]|nr:biotin/lipoyl-binding protein [Chloroflexota bacterium]